jgi:hypothetical protein
LLLLELELLDEPLFPEVDELEPCAPLDSWFDDCLLADAPLPPVGVESFTCWEWADVVLDGLDSPPDPWWSRFSYSQGGNPVSTEVRTRNGT